MKLFLKNSFYFVTIAFISYIAILVLWGTFLPQSFHKNLRYGLSSGYLDKRLNEAESINKIDLLIIGSSHAYRGYDIRIFDNNNISAFNLGSSAQTPKQSLLLLQKYIYKMKPKMVLFDVYPEVFCLDGVESTLDLLSNSDKNEKELVTLALETRNIKVYNTLIYSSFQKKFSISKRNNNQNSFDEGKYIKGGYVETIKKSKPKNDYVPKTNNMLPYQIEAFNQILKLLEKEKIPVILVQSPLRKNFYKSILNNHETDKFFSSKAKYYNFNELIICNEDMFADERHLNQEGVDFFNNELIKRIDFLKYLNKK